MPGFDGTGPRGMGPMTGGGRGFCAVPIRTAWWPYRVPRSADYAYGITPYEHDINFLRDEAQALRRTLEGIDARIKELTGEK
jgi:hypothetical protein